MTEVKFEVWPEHRDLDFSEAITDLDERDHPMYGYFGTDDVYIDCDYQIGDKAVFVVERIVGDLVLIKFKESEAGKAFKQLYEQYKDEIHIYPKFYSRVDYGTLIPVAFKTFVATFNYGDYAHDTEELEDAV